MAFVGVAGGIGLLGAFERDPSLLFGDALDELDVAGRRLLMQPAPSVCEKVGPVYRPGGIRLICASSRAICVDHRDGSILRLS